MKEGTTNHEYFIICPICKRKADVELTGEYSFHAKCECGAEYSGVFSKKPLTDVEVKGAMEKLKDVRE